MVRTSVSYKTLFFYQQSVVNSKLYYSMKIIINKQQQQKNIQEANKQTNYKQKWHSGLLSTPVIFFPLIFGGPKCIYESCERLQGKQAKKKD